jgi:hypothetical protein
VELILILSIIGKLKTRLLPGFNFTLRQTKLLKSLGPLPKAALTGSEVFTRLFSSNFTVSSHSTRTVALEIEVLVFLHDKDTVDIANWTLGRAEMLFIDAELERGLHEMSALTSGEHNIKASEANSIIRIRMARFHRISQT